MPVARFGYSLRFVFGKIHIAPPVFKYFEILAINKLYDLSVHKEDKYSDTLQKH